MRTLFALLLSCLSSWPAQALVIAAEDQSATTRPPLSDPGWGRVGQRGDTGAIYLGKGWVLTANHVGVGTLVLDGKSYSPVPGSMVQLENADGGSKADLILFRIERAPDLPLLPLRRETPPPDFPVLLIGYGQGRGRPFRWPPRVQGFVWDGEGKKRWGTNRVYGKPHDVTRDSTTTRSFSTRFAPAGTPHEAQAALGDSGGAAFVRDRRGWRLVGVLFAVGEFEGQQPGMALYGNVTNIADLSYYREQILEIVAPR